MMEIALLAILIGLAWFWLDTMDKREKAIQHGKELAHQFNAQLLDETVACTALSLRRNQRGHIQLLRTYEFEVSPFGDTRVRCQVILLGSQLLSYQYDTIKP